MHMSLGTEIYVQNVYNWLTVLTALLTVIEIGLHNQLYNGKM